MAKKIQPFVEKYAKELKKIEDKFIEAACEEVKKSCDKCCILWLADKEYEMQKFYFANKEKIFQLVEKFSDIRELILKEIEKYIKMGDTNCYEQTVEKEKALGIYSGETESQLWVFHINKISFTEAHSLWASNIDKEDKMNGNWRLIYIKFTINSWWHYVSKEYRKNREEYETKECEICDLLVDIYKINGSKKILINIKRDFERVARRLLGKEAEEDDILERKKKYEKWLEEIFLRHLYKEQWIWEIFVNPKTVLDEWIQVQFNEEFKKMLDEDQITKLEKLFKISFDQLVFYFPINSAKDIINCNQTVYMINTIAEKNRDIFKSLDENKNVLTAALWLSITGNSLGQSYVNDDNGIENSIDYIWKEQIGNGMAIFSLHGKAYILKNILYEIKEGEKVKKKDRRLVRYKKNVDCNDSVYIVAEREEKYKKNQYERYLINLERKIKNDDEKDEIQEESKEFSNRLDEIAQFKFQINKKLESEINPQSKPCSFKIHFNRMKMIQEGLSSMGMEILEEYTGFYLSIIIYNGTYQWMKSKNKTSDFKEDYEEVREEVGRMTQILSKMHCSEYRIRIAKKIMKLAAGDITMGYLYRLRVINKHLEKKVKEFNELYETVYQEFLLYLCSDERWKDIEWVVNCWEKNFQDVIQVEYNTLKICFDKDLKEEIEMDFMTKMRNLSEKEDSRTDEYAWFNYIYSHAKGRPFKAIESICEK